MRNAGSRFAGSTQRAGVARRTLPGGSTLSVASTPASYGSGASAAGPARITYLLLTALGALAAIALSLALLPSAAGAATIHVEDTTFELQTPGSPGAIAVDEEAGYIYVLRRGFPNSGDIERFDSAGNPVNFPGSPGRNETQQINFQSFAGGDKYTLTCPNGETTGEIVWTGIFESTQNNMKAGLEAKCGAGNFGVSGGPSFVTVTFQGAFAETDVPKMTCTKTTGSGTCSITSETNGASELNVIDTVCQESCMDIAVDNSGGPNQGTIYVSTLGGQTFCCPVQPNFQSGGIHVYLASGPAGLKVGNIFTTSQVQMNVASCGVAVDDNGDLIVAHGSSIPFSYFDRLDITGDWESSPNLNPAVLGTIKSDHANPCRSDVDSDGAVYDTAGTSLFASGPLRKYTANAFETVPDQGGPFPAPSAVPSLTLATGSHVDVTEDEEGNVITFLTNGELRKWSTENGSPIEAFDTPLFEPAGVTRNNSLNDGTLYVTDRSGNVAAEDITVFESLIVPDSVTGGFDPDAVLGSKGVVDGELDPDGGGEVLSCQFEVVSQTKFQSSGFAEATVVPCAEGGTFNAPANVSAELTGLTLEEQHHFRLKTTNANGSSLGSIHRFTPHAVINIATEAATGVTPGAATLNGSFEGNGEAVSYYFEWGTNAGLGKETAVQSAGSPTGPATMDFDLGTEDIDPEQTYHYRVVATNSQGTSKGQILTFSTPPAVTNLQTKPASSLDQEDITLNAEFDGDGLETTYYFEYGLTPSYGEVTPTESAGVTNGPTQVSADIEEFSGFKTYHYRIVAENVFGKTVGQNETFQAPDPLEPGVTNTRVVSVSPTTATVAADINPNHWATIYLFEWGETDNYGTALPFSAPIGGLDNEEIPVTAEITGLEPGSIYHFRAVALNFKGTTEGENVIFITPDVPRIDSTFANAIGETTAHLGATVAARGSATTVSFEYGPTAAYGQSTAANAIGSDLFPREVGADVAGLAPGTLYHYRVVATNGIGTTYGPDQTFSTAGGSQPLGPTENCGQLARQAKKASASAKRLRKQAAQARGKRARSLRSRARRFAKQAQRKSKAAKACRSTSGGSGQ